MLVGSEMHAYNVKGKNTKGEKSQNVIYIKGVL